jgi:hypothetical protein
MGPSFGAKAARAGVQRTKPLLWPKKDVKGFFAWIKSNLRKKSP